MKSLNAVSADLLKPRLGLSVAVIAVIALTIGSGIAWSVQANVIEVASGQGRVIPSGRIKLVQSLEGGIVGDIHVQEGTTVEKGDLLISIDPIKANATLAENRVGIRALGASTVWMKAILDDKEPVFEQPEDDVHARAIERHRFEYIATLDQFKSTMTSHARLAEQKRLELAETQTRLKNAKQSKVLADERLVMFEKLRKNRAASKADLLSAQSNALEVTSEVEALELATPRLEAAIAEIEARRSEDRAKFRAMIAGRLNEASTKLAGLREAEAVDLDRVTRSEMRAPVRGIVKTLHTNTIGQVVRPAENIVELVPVDDALLVRVEVQPKDIAFLHVDQDAVIKLTAYDYALYGALQGEVVRVGADSITDDQGNTFFPVDIKSDAAWLQKGDSRLPILPGMVAQVDIVTGEKTVFNYITKPIHRTASEAFKER